MRFEIRSMIIVLLLSPDDGMKVISTASTEACIWAAEDRQMVDHVYEVMICVTKDIMQLLANISI